MINAQTAEEAEMNTTYMHMTLRINPKDLPTAQHKGQNHKTGRTYTLPRVRNAAKLLAAHIKASRQFCPEHDGAWRLTLTLLYRPATFPQWMWGQPKITAPDTDNLLKLVKDVIQDCGIAYASDAQVFDEHTRKMYVADPFVEPHCIIELERIPCRRA